MMFCLDLLSSWFTMMHIRYIFYFFLMKFDLEKYLLNLSILNIHARTCIYYSYIKKSRKLVWRTFSFLIISKFRKNYLLIFCQLNKNIFVLFYFFKKETNSWKKP